VGQRSDEVGRRPEDVSPVDRDVTIDRDVIITSDQEGAVVPDDQASPEEIRADIERTRADMSETIDAIQERLSPQTLKEEAKEQVREQFQEVKETVREATIGKAEDMVRSAGDTATQARYTIVETVKQNPIPAALVGLGLGWLYMNRRSGPSTSRVRYQDRGIYTSSEFPYEARSSYYTAGQQPYESRSTSGGMYSRTQETGGGVTSRARETAGGLASRTQETASNVVGQAQETASNVVGQARETADQLASQAQYQAQRVEDRFQQTLQENPLALGAIAVVLGAAVGLAVPATQKEHELMGETRDSLLEQAKSTAQSTAQDAMQKVERVAQEAQSAAKQVEHVAQEVQSATKQDAQQ